MTKQKDLENRTKTESSSFPSDYEEQEDASFLKFEEIGDSILGKLLVKAKSTRYDFNLYTVQLANGDTIRFHGTQQLDTLLASVEEGDNIFVEYIDNTPTPSGTMKLFKVGIKRKK